MADAFESFATGLSGPYTDAVAVTPNDSTDIDTTRALYVGGVGTGDLSVVMASGNQIEFADLKGDEILPIRVTRVRATGTNVTGIVALY